MKKTFLIIAGAVLLALGSIAVAVSIERNSGSTIFEDNVEALANGENGGEAAIALCDRYCKFSTTNNCILFTREGYQISCNSMEPWML